MPKYPLIWLTSCLPVTNKDQNFQWSLKDRASTRLSGALGRLHLKCPQNLLVSVVWKVHRMQNVQWPRNDFHPPVTSPYLPPSLATCPSCSPCLLSQQQVVVAPFTPPAIPTLLTHSGIGCSESRYILAGGFPLQGGVSWLNSTSFPYSPLLWPLFWQQRHPSSGGSRCTSSPHQPLLETKRLLSCSLGRWWQVGGLRSIIYFFGGGNFIFV